MHLNTGNQTPFWGIANLGSPSPPHGVTGGEKGCPLTFFTRKFLVTYQEKREKEEMENGEEKKENFKEFEREEVEN